MAVAVIENKTEIKVTGVKTAVSPMPTTMRLIVERRDEHTVLSVTRPYVNLTVGDIARMAVVSVPSIQIITVGSQGPSGPPGTARPDLDKMVHPSYPASIRRFDYALGVITAIRVVDEGETQIMVRTLSYDGSGRISEIVTDDMTSSARLIKTINYGPDGTITSTLREMTTCQ